MVTHREVLPWSYTTRRDVILGRSGNDVARSLACRITPGRTGSTKRASVRFTRALRLRSAGRLAAQGPLEDKRTIQERSSSPCGPRASGSSCVVPDTESGRYPLVRPLGRKGPISVLE